MIIIIIIIIIIMSFSTGQPIAFTHSLTVKGRAIFTMSTKFKCRSRAFIKRLNVITQITTSFFFINIIELMG